MPLGMICVPYFRQILSFATPDFLFSLKNGRTLNKIAYLRKDFRKKRKSEHY